MSEPPGPDRDMAWTPPEAFQPAAPVVQRAPHYPQPLAPSAPAARRHRWLAPTIILGSVVLVGALAVGALWAVGSVIRGGFAATDQPLAEGEPGAPVAVSPMSCADVCFDSNAVRYAVAAPELFIELGVGDTTHPYGTFDPTTAGDLYRGLAAGWVADHGEPAQCIFAVASAPYAATLDDANADVEDLVYFIGTQEDPPRLSSADQAVRIFRDAASAQEFMIDAAQSIAACTEVEIGGAGERYFAQIDPAAALRLPDSVAGIGWTRTGDPGPRWRAYAVFLQRGNMVVLNRLLTDGSITEHEFRIFVEQHAEELAAITAVG